MKILSCANGNRSEIPRRFNNMSVSVCEDGKWRELSKEEEKDFFRPKTYTRVYWNNGGGCT